MSVPLSVAIVFSVCLLLVFPCIIFLFFKNKKWLVFTYFTIYFAVLFVGVFGKIGIGQNVTISFDFSHNAFDPSKFLLYDFGVQNILINIFMFFPISMLVFCTQKKNILLKTIIFGFLLSVFIEFMQFALPISRSVELTDVLFNTLSALLSYCFFFALSKLQKK